MIVRIFNNPLLFGPVSLLIAAAYFGSNRDFGSFLLRFIVVPVLFLFSLIYLFIAASRNISSPSVAIGGLMLLAAPVCAFAASQLRDRVRFFGWAITHPTEIANGTRTDAIIMQWDSWGMAGSGNDFYLISDIHDDSSTVSSAEGWRLRAKLECPIVETQKCRGVCT